MSYIIYLFFYGFLLTAILGLLASWIDRKVTARIQYRVGPPLFQPLIDIIKLLGKEMVIPIKASKLTFVSAPIIALGSVVVVSTILWVNNFTPHHSFIGDMIVVVYFLIIPSISLMIGGFASGNPYASLGASREMKLILAYELPFILAMLVPIIKADFTLKLGEIILLQSHQGLIAGSLSGLIALLVALLSIQAKLGLVPFDIAEAETEIISGLLIEYSGPGLALFRLTKNMLLFILPFFLIILFLGGFNSNILVDLIKYILILFLIIVIRNTNPRLRIDQAIKFFWGPMTGLAIIAVILALLGI